MKYGSLDEWLTELENYSGGWSQYRQQFLNCSPNDRVVELTSFDKLLENEHKITRQHAEIVTKRREMQDLHNLLLRAGK